MNEAFYQTQIIRHLGNNGSISDKNGLQWVMMFVVKLMEVPQFKKIVDGSGFTFLDLMGAYIAVIEATMPIPVVQLGSGRRQFIPDLIFNVPEVLESILNTCAKNLKVAGIPQEAAIEEQIPMNGLEFIQRLQQPTSPRRSVINQTFAEYAFSKRESMNAANGPAVFEIQHSGSGLNAPKVGGCASLILSALVIVEILRHALL